MGKRKTSLGRNSVLVVLLSLLFVLGLASCGDAQPKAPSGVQADPSAAGSAEPEEESSEAGVAEENTPAESVTIEETELYNEHDIVVTAKSYDAGGIFGPEVAVAIENNSDKNILVSTADLAVNGYMMNNSCLSCQVAAGKAANSEITLYRSDLDESGIETVGTMEFSIQVSDYDTWDEIDTSERITLNTSLAEGLVQPVDDSGDLIYDDNDVRVICKGLKEDAFWDGQVVFYIENNGSRSVSISADQVSVNGYMTDVSLWADLYAETKNVNGMYLLDVEEIETLDEIENIEFTLSIIDEDTWETIATSDVIALNFN